MNKTVGAAACCWAELTLPPSQQQRRWHCTPAALHAGSTASCCRLMGRMGTIRLLVRGAMPCAGCPAPAKAGSAAVRLLPCACQRGERCRVVAALRLPTGERCRACAALRLPTWGALPWSVPPCACQRWERCHALVALQVYATEQKMAALRDAQVGLGTGGAHCGRCCRPCCAAGRLRQLAGVLARL